MPANRALEKRTAKPAIPLQNAITEKTKELVPNRKMKPFDTLQLETDRLNLQPLAAGDVGELFSIHSDPDVMKYWSSPPWDDLNPAREMIVKDLEALKEGRYLRLGIKTKAQDKLIGICSFFDFFTQCKRAEIGYILAKSHWGKGYMYEALTALIDYSFNQLDLHRIEADIDPRNRASAKILNRLGFVKEGHLRERWIIAGKISDSCLYGLLRSDWLHFQSGI